MRGRGEGRLQDKERTRLCLSKPQSKKQICRLAGTEVQGKDRQEGLSNYREISATSAQRILTPRNANASQHGRIQFRTCDHFPLSWCCVSLPVAQGGSHPFPRYPLKQ